MRRLRRTVVRFSRLAGPVLGLAMIVCVGGFGLHAARDWHRHGELAAGFFHLHFHVGDHEHHGHQHPAHDDRDHESPTDTKPQRTAVLTIAQALHNNASAPLTVAHWKHAPDRTPIDSVALPRSTQPTSLANPRAPPV